MNVDNGSNNGMEQQSAPESGSNRSLRSAFTWVRIIALVVVAAALLIKPVVTLTSTGKDAQMFDLESFVDTYYPRIMEVGLTVQEDKATALERMKAYPSEMLESTDEEFRIVYLFSALTINDALQTDFEGLEYEDFFEQVQRVMGNDLVFEDVQADISDETLESGEGTCTVSFRCNGKECQYLAAYSYDWFDPNIIHHLNALFEEQGLEKRLIVFGDAGKYTIVYQLPEFVERFKAAFPEVPISVV